MITEEQKNSILNYKKVGIEISEIDSSKVKIKQISLINGYILNNKQLYNRAREIFPNRHIIPVVYSLNCKEINLEWIEAKMIELGINKKDLIKQLAIEKSNMELLFSNKTKLTNRTKAAFFYYFLSFELNNKLRDNNI